MAEWSAVIKTTAPKFIKSAVDATIRKRILLSMLKKKGRISLNESGYKVYWQIETSQPAMTSYADGGVVDYSRHDAWQQPVLDWRGYVASDAATKKQRLMNSGPQQLVDTFGKIVPKLTKACTDKLGSEAYIDGNATNNQNRFHGIESMMGVDSTYGTSSSGAVAADKIAKPTDTYAGLSTAAGALGGSWGTTGAGFTPPNASIATDWPDGVGTTEYDAWTPKLMNWASSAWTGTTTWVSTNERCMRQAIIWTSLNSGQEGQMDLILLAGNLYNDFLNNQSTKQRIIVDDGAKELGFPGVYNFDGVMVAPEFGMAANTGYGFNFDQMELLSLQSQLFEPEGPNFDPKTLSWLFAITCMGNFRFETPKGFCKFFNYAAT